VPQTRDGSFSTGIFQRYQRGEQAFVLALMEMAVQGVSTRKVAAITEELSGVRFLVSDSQGASRQRCQIHLMRNLPGHSQDKLKAEAAIAARPLLAEQNEVWQERKYSRIWMSSGIG